MVCGNQMLAPVLDPFHRPAGKTRGKRDQKILGVEFAPDAKPTADIVLDHVDRVLGQTHLARQDAAIEKRHLAGP